MCFVQHKAPDHAKLKLYDQSFLGFVKTMFALAHFSF